MCPVDQSKRAAEGLGGRKAREGIKSKTVANLELDKTLEMSVVPGYDRKGSQIWLYLRSRLLKQIWISWRLARSATKRSL